MLTRDRRVELSEITDFNLLKSELKRLPAVDVGDYIAELGGTPVAARGSVSLPLQ